MTRHWARWLTAPVFTLVMLLLWLIFAPPQLGGATIYSATVGNSMEPKFHAGDLALIRAASSYKPGDVTLYESPILHRPVLHRILVVQDGRYYLKGDNNDFVDPGYVTRRDLLGKLWLQAPGAGSVLSWFGVPLHASMLAAVAAVSLLLGSMRAPRRRRRGWRRRGLVRPPGRPLVKEVSQHVPHQISSSA